MVKEIGHELVCPWFQQLGGAEQNHIAGVNARPRSIESLIWVGGVYDGRDGSFGTEENCCGGVLAVAYAVDALDVDTGRFKRAAEQRAYSVTCHFAYHPYRSTALSKNDGGVLKS